MVSMFPGRWHWDRADLGCLELESESQEMTDRERNALYSFLGRLSKQNEEGPLDKSVLLIG